MTNRLRHLGQLLLLTALVLVVGAPVAAAPPPADLMVAARPAYEGIYRVGTWMPVLVELQNAGVDRTVQVRVGTREGAQYATEVELPHQGRKAVTVYVYMTPASSRLLIRVLAGDQELSNQTMQLTPINQGTRLVGLIAPQGAAHPPTRLPAGLGLQTVVLPPADLPEQPLGLSSLNVLVLEAVRTADLRPAQLAALHAWVLRGGQLVLSGGTGLATTLAGLPASLRPVAVETVTTAAAGTFFGHAANDDDVPLARLVPIANLGERMPYAVPLSVAAGKLQAVEQSLGRGTVVAVSLPLGYPTLATWTAAAQLWEELLHPALELPPGFAPDTMTLDSFTEGNVATALTSLPALEFPPLGLLAALVAVYIVLVGPGTYLVLRHLDHQALGWVIVPALTLIFAGLTYSLGYAQRGGDLVFNQVTLLEPIAGAEEQTRVRTFVGVFSPAQRAYDFAVAATMDTAADPLLRPVSLQGPWDASPLGNQGVYLQTTTTRAEVRDFEVAQWAMRALTAESTVALPGLTATLRLADATVTGEVTNGTTLTLRDVTLVQGNRIFRAGDLPPGAMLRGELKVRQEVKPDGRGPMMPISYLVYGEMIDRQGTGDGQPLSPTLQQRIKILDALYNYGSSPRGSQPILLAWPDASTLAVQPTEQRADQQHSTVLLATPRLVFGDGMISLEQGWLTPRFEGGMPTVCFGGQGSGIIPGPQAAMVQLALPRDLFGLRPSELTLLTTADGPWSDATLIELYAWQSGTWVPQTVTMGTGSVANPERYLGSHGMLRLRLTGTANQMNPGCLYVDAQLKGVLP